MKKLRLIIAREYLTRVKTRSFLLTTLLTPLGIALFGVVAGMIIGYEGDNSTIIIRDEAGLVDSTFIAKVNKSVILKIDKGSEPIDSLVAHSSIAENGILYLPKFKTIDSLAGITYYSDNALGVITQNAIERELARCIRDRKIAASGYERSILNSFETEVRIEQRTAESKEDKTAKQAVAYAIGGIMGLIIYVILLVYGSMVMRSVVEEKTSRIVEVMISSVKPFQLMLGKMIGVGLVGLTQITAWLLLTITVQGILAAIVGAKIAENAAKMQQMPPNMAGTGAPNLEMLQNIDGIIESVMSQNWLLIIPLFLFYFVGGYFLYAAMFAAAGSASGDDIADSQALTMPITIPVILAIYIMFAVIQNPNSSLAKWSSQVPFFSPIVMPARLPFGPAWWEIVLSVVILGVSSLGAVWLSGRIYRVGILLYGKRASFSDVAKWIFR
jgi:ABC-2 type transport system permease protein